MSYQNNVALDGRIWDSIGVSYGRVNMKAGNFWVVELGYTDEFGMPGRMKTMLTEQEVGGDKEDIEEDVVLSRSRSVSATSPASPEKGSDGRWKRKPLPPIDKAVFAVWASIVMISKDALGVTWWPELIPFDETLRWGNGQLHTSPAAALWGAREGKDWESQIEWYVEVTVPLVDYVLQVVSNNEKLRKSIADAMMSDQVQVPLMIRGQIEKMTGGM